MSQQINLLNPALRQRQDWLRANVVAMAALACLGLVVIASIGLGARQRSLQAAEAEAGVRLRTAQERLQAMTKGLGERKPDPALAQRAENLAAAVQLRQEAMRHLDRKEGARFSEAMRGLARQSMDGLWLTGFAVGGEDMEIRGRMLDPSLLPAYIRRLNAEPAFHGRRFDALDMRGVDARPAGKPDAAAKPGPVRLLPPYVEFALRAGAPKDTGRPEARP